MEKITIKNTMSAETVKREVEQMIAHQEHVVSGKEEAERFLQCMVLQDMSMLMKIEGSLSEGN